MQDLLCSVGSAMVAFVDVGVGEGKVSLGVVAGAHFSGLYRFLR